jgi:hypothetical protein
MRQPGLGNAIPMIHKAEIEVDEYYNLRKNTEAWLFSVSWQAIMSDVSLPASVWPN